jgi:hypothetical protein
MSGRVLLREDVLDIKVTTFIIFKTDRIFILTSYLFLGPLLVSTYSPQNFAFFNVPFIRATYWANPNTLNLTTQRILPE